MVRTVSLLTTVTKFISTPHHLRFQLLQLKLYRERCSAQCASLPHDCSHHVTTPWLTPVCLRTGGALERRGHVRSARPVSARRHLHQHRHGRRLRVPQPRLPRRLLRKGSVQPRGPRALRHRGSGLLSRTALQSAPQLLSKRCHAYEGPFFM